MQYLKILCVLSLLFFVVGAASLSKSGHRTLMSFQVFGVSNSTGIACGDLNDDGYIDVIVSNENQPDTVWLGNGTGYLHQKDQESDVDGIQGFGTSSSRSVALADFDHDGHLDAVVANYKQPNTWWANTGQGQFVKAGDFGNASLNTQDVQVADFNQDAWPDVIFCNGKDNDEIWENTGYGNFTLHQKLTAGASRGARIGDLNGDTLPDIVIVHYYSQNDIWLQAANGTFSQATGVGGAYNASSSCVDLGDIDADGDLDIVIGNYFNQPNRVYRNDGLDNGGGMLFTEVDQDTDQPGMQGFGQNRSRDLRLIDADGDGDLDCFVVNSADGIDGANRLWLNNGHGVFTDSGLRIGSGFSYAVETQDVNFDNSTDFLVANYEGQPNQIWMNRKALFAVHPAWLEDNATQAVTNAVTVADINGDGSADVFVANQGHNQVFLNRGNGRFDPSQVLTDSANSTDVGLGDLDHDGDVDAVVSNANASCKVFTYAHGEFSGTQTLNSTGTGLALHDLNGDGWVDVFLVRGALQGNEVWLNDHGMFKNTNQTLGNANSTSVVLGDIDHDGDIDACVSNFGTNSTLWTNNGNGTFGLQYTLPETGDSTDAALGDIDNDGDLDLVISNYGGFSTVWENMNSTWTLVQEFGSGDSTAIALRDFDLDGDLDIALSNDNDQGVRLWMNDGHGKFKENSQAIGLQSSQDLAVHDLDGDTDPDIFIGNASPNAVWLNDELQPATGGGGGGGCS